jgi:erythromycin esterase-like protein
MRLAAKRHVVDLVREHARPFESTAGSFEPLLDQIGDAHFVLLGEASHGTHEFYKARAEITKRLIRENGFNAVAVEADWPDAYRVNRFVRGRSDDVDAEESLTDFKRFPTWMWRNADVLDFVGWLREHNERCRHQAGFYGLDLYSLYSSVEAVLGYLKRVDPDAAKRARQRYSCFEAFAHDSQSYGYSAASGMVEPCEAEVVKQLVELQRHAADYRERDGQVAEDEFFFAEQNARLVKNAEEYYRSMFRGRVSSWNLRDRHMVETLEALVRHLERQLHREPRVVLWAHNSHLGDARHTQMGERGEWNVGQLVRERFGDDAVLVGFTTHTGTVSAASEWGAPVERKQVRPAMEGSYERLFHETGLERFYLNLHADEELRRELFDPPRLERAIGVIYQPQTERYSHYFTRGSRGNSMRCCTSTRRAPWNRWSARPNGTPAKRPRRSPSALLPQDKMTPRE